LYKEQFIGWYLKATNTTREEVATERLFTKRIDRTQDVQDQIKKTFGYAYTAAVATSTMRIQNCKATPSVIQIKSGEYITFVNSDTVNQVIDFNYLDEIDMQPGEIKKINSEELIGASVGKNEMNLLNFICGGIKQPAGYILIKQ
jgi:plastocyanin